MTGEQIVKALEQCFYNRDTCGDCPYRPNTKDKAECLDRLGKDALELIRRQQEKIGSLEKIQQSYSSAYYKLQCYNTDLQAEIDKKNELLEYVKAKSEDIQNLVIERRETSLKIYEACKREAKTARAEAIKEFAEKLKNYVFPVKIDKDARNLMEWRIDDLVKEMVGESNEAD